MIRKIIIKSKTYNLKNISSNRRGKLEENNEKMYLVLVEKKKTWSIWNAESKCTFNLIVFELPYILN